MRDDDVIELTATEHVLASDFDDETKRILLHALTYSDCRDCVRQAHKALHDMDEE
ncbi:hypothetical protein BH09ACT8_BH09ACT8_61500 [soil metagenome]